MEILIEIKHVPEGTTVYKKTGNAAFVVKDSLKIYAYGESGSNLTDKKVLVEPGIKYMVNERGDINMVSENTVVKINLLDDEEDGGIDTYLLERIISSITGADIVSIDVDWSK